MTSTFLGYQLYAGNITRSLARVDGEAANKSAKAYYEANIGKVKTVDDLIKDYRLFSYATKAYGLDDMAYAKSFLRKVLTSDLSDSGSLANRLTDTRYRAFAQAFGFATDGTVAKPSIQTAGQQTTTLALFESRTAATLSDATRTEAESYYKAHIGAVTSVKALEGDAKLKAFVLTAYGMNAATPDATLEGLVEGSLADPASLANTTAGAGYGALQAAVNVGPSGGVSTVMAPAQSNDAIASTVASYLAAVPTDGTSRAIAKTESAYYSNAVAGLTKVDDLLGDSRLVAYLTKAFALPANVTSTTLRQVLTSDPADPTSTLNLVSDPSLKAVGQAFSFGQDGTLKPLPFQTIAQQNATATLYAARQAKDSDALDTETAYYRAHIGAITTVSQLEADSRLYNYVLTAHGVNPSSTPAGTVEQVLEQNPADPASVVATTAGSGALAFASAFAVDGKGVATGAPAAQTSGAIDGVVAAFLATAKPDAPSQRAANAEAAYYRARMGAVTSLGEVLNDPRLVGVIVKGYGLPAGTSADQVRSILQADKAAVPALTTRYGSAVATLRAAFSFGSNGLLARATTQGAQTAAQTLATETLYSRVNLESSAGQASEGVRLALYFQRLAPTVTGPYSILADKALAQVFQTLLNLPANSAKADIDVQARYLSSRITFTDLKDPAKVAKMTQRFAAMYDLANPDSTTQNRVSMLFGGSG